MILYEDKEILVCRKSSGIAVQSARLGEKDLVSILNNHLAEQAKLRETSGNGAKMKAAGGISSLDDAEKFLSLGADRLGTSRIVKIVKQEEATGY